MALYKGRTGLIPTASAAVQSALVLASELTKVQREGGMLLTRDELHARAAASQAACMDVIGALTAKIGQLCDVELEARIDEDGTVTIDRADGRSLVLMQRQPPAASVAVDVSQLPTARA